MCGINGIFSKIQVNDLERRISKMNSSIIHRGPDAGGMYFDNQRLGFGHRRLSIIDVSTHSNQPMSTLSNRWHIVFNGEIYNFREIRKRLNYNFQTNSDTEVILAAVEEKGLEWFLGHSNGMFAIGLYDSFKEELFLVRDRLGIKPLYYHFDGQKLIFSSEIKAILESGLVSAKFNEKAVDEYLGYRYVRSPYTFFENILQVNPGTFIRFNQKLEKRSVKYWDIPNKFNTLTEYSENEILKGFEVELLKAIKYRLISDVPLGTYLSGGVDSSIITAIAANAKTEKLNTYTIGFPEINEFKYSRLIANKYNTNHHEILMKKDDYLNNWDKLIRFKDAPLGVPNEIPLAVMSEKLKEKITVVLSGEGADELLGGYGRIFRSPFDYQNSSERNDFYSYFIDKYEYVPRDMRDRLINTSIEYRLLFDDKIRCDFLNHANEENVFRFFHKYHVKGLLQRVDMTTMQISVEARVPFLDHNLIEFTYSEIPYELKLKWKDEKAKLQARKESSDLYSEKLDIPKYMLRKLGYKYLPKEIIERKKVGFPVPLTEWFGDLENLAHDLLSDADWLKKGVVEKLIRESKIESRSGQVLWMFINIEIFRKIYFNRSWEW